MGEPREEMRYYSGFRDSDDGRAARRERDEYERGWNLGRESAALHLEDMAAEHSDGYARRILRAAAKKIRTQR